MTMQQGAVCKAFERALNGVYGHSLFAVDEIGRQSNFRVREDPQHYLQLATFYTCELNTNRAAYGLGDRWAGHFFLMRQMSGEIRLRFGNDAPVVLRKGDVLLMSPYSDCEYMSARANEVAVIPFPFDFGGGDAPVLAACGQRIATNSASGAVLGSALSAMLAGQGSIDPEDQKVMREVIRNLLVRVVAATPTEPDTARLAQADGLMRRARNLALANLANPDLSPDSIAAGIGVSRRHLYRAFAEQGQTPGNWIWALRTESAHLRLISPELREKSLTELAFEVGFNDMAHFSRTYRARFGRTPREARMAVLSGL